MSEDKCPVCGKPGPYKVYPPMEGCYHPKDEVLTEEDELHGDNTGC